MLMKQPCLAAHGLRLGEPFPPEVFRQIHLRLALECCKWDPQVGDEEVLFRQPLLLERDSWKTLAATAEQMAMEIAGFEHYLLGHDELLSMLGMPRPLARIFRRVHDRNASDAVRTLRFDFHPTPEGWKVSEVNSDVPGGFTESSHFTEMVAKYYPGLQPTGNPLRAWSQAIRSSIAGRNIGILYAAGYMEDQQLVSLLGATLERQGCRAHFMQNPAEIQWFDEQAYLERAQVTVRLDAIVRFYQGEWLATMSTKTGWPCLFAPSRTMVTNPGYSLLAESKRFPLVWPHFPERVSKLKEMFPECRDPREVIESEDEWVFKAAYSNTGEAVIMPSLLPKAECERFRTMIRRHANSWVAQRRFVTTAIHVDAGEFTPCIGVFTINGKAEGAYARLSRYSLIDYRASEAAVLIENG